MHCGFITIPVIIVFFFLILFCLNSFRISCLLLSCWWPSFNAEWNPADNVVHTKDSTVESVSCYVSDFEVFAKSWVTLCDLMFSWWWPWTSLFFGVLIYEVWYLLTINFCGVVSFYRSTWHHVPQKSNVWWLILFTQDRTLYHLISYSTNSTVFFFHLKPILLIVAEPPHVMWRFSVTLHVT